MRNCIKPEFLDIVNCAICQAVDDYLGGKAAEFFKKVGEYHFEEAVERGLIKIALNDEPIDGLTKVAKYLESVGYMDRILINKLDKKEISLEMYGVSVTKSSTKMIRKGKEPSHFMTHIMRAALKKLGIQAELEKTTFDEEKRHFKEHWKILE